MGVNTEGGKRSVAAAVEVTGAPEEVWRAIATGAGVSSWFVPTEMRADGTIVSHFGPGMDSVATQTAWEPPRRFATESEMGPGAPKMATEWIVEARDGGTCMVRVVHSVVTADDTWNDRLAMVEKGWADYFEILRNYLQHFSGRASACIQLVGMSKMSDADAWTTLAGSLGFRDAKIGDRRTSPAGSPTLAGVVERGAGAGHAHQLLVRAQEPCDALVHAFAMNMGGTTIIVVRLHLYGEEARAVAGREEPIWQSWLLAHFPLPARGPAAGS